MGHLVGFLEQPFGQFDVWGRANGRMFPIGLNLFDRGVGLAARGTGVRAHAVGFDGGAGRRTRGS